MDTASAQESSKLLRAALHAAFPATKFSVRLSRGTAYGYCNVSWTDGPTPQRVEAITARFEGSSFDGMQDMEISKRTLLADGRYTGLRGINCERMISAEFARRIAAAISTYYDGLPEPTILKNGNYWTLATSREVGENAQALLITGRSWGDLIYRASRDRMTVTPERESRCENCDKLLGKATEIAVGYCEPCQSRLDADRLDVEYDEEHCENCGDLLEDSTDVLCVTCNCSSSAELREREINRASADR